MIQYVVENLTEGGYYNWSTQRFGGINVAERWNVEEQAWDTAKQLARQLNQFMTVKPVAI